MLISNKSEMNRFNRNIRENAIPLSLAMELTPRCSLDCKMCYVHLTKEQMGDRKELTAEQWKRVLDEAIEMGTMTVLLTGGECMMHPEFREIYDYIMSKPVLLNLNTNATLINDEYMKLFTEKPPHRIKISLYGNSEDGYEKVTGHRVFTRVRDNILKLKAAGVYVKVAITVCKQLYDETLDIVKFVRDHKIEYSLDMAMFEAAEGTGRSSADYALTPEEVVEKYIELGRYMGREPYENEQITTIPSCKCDLEPIYGLRCGAGRSIAAVRWDGDVQPCLLNKFPGTYNVLEHSFAEAWKKANEAAKKQIIPVECMSCRFAFACNSCALYRMDPNNPGHRNVEVCKDTIKKLNSGVIKMKSIEELMREKEENPLMY